MPLGQGSGSVFLENFTAGKVAILVEVVVDRSIDIGKIGFHLIGCNVRYGSITDISRTSIYVRFWG